MNDPKTQEQRLDWLVEEFKEDSGTYRDLQTPDEPESKRQLLRSLMNIRMPRPIGEDILRVQDAYLAARAGEKGIVTPDEIPVLRLGAEGAGSISIWQGAAIIDANAEYYLTWPSLQYSVSWIEYEKDELNKVILDSNGNPIVKSTEARDKIVASFRTIESFFTTQLVETVSDAVMIQDNVAYWLSSEYTAQGDNYCNAAIVGVFSATSVQRNAQIFKQTKYYTLPIRPILAF